MSKLEKPASCLRWSWYRKACPSPSLSMYWLSLYRNEKPAILISIICPSLEEFWYSTAKAPSLTLNRLWVLLEIILHILSSFGIVAQDETVKDMYKMQWNYREVWYNSLTQDQQVLINWMEWHWVDIQHLLSNNNVNFYFIYN